MNRLLRTLRNILAHPLNKGARGQALLRYLRWQLGSRLVPGPVAVPFINDALLLAQPGMTGATGNIYCGLLEFGDMGFLLHALRADDLFVDVGANVGVYTVLSAAAVGAKTVAIEPLPSAFGFLQRNIALNGISARVEALNIGLSAASGTLRFTSALDTVNHVLAPGEEQAHLAVPVRTLDDVLGARVPAFIKIDVEGFETEVIAGAARTLADERLLGLVIELNGSGRRYGYDDAQLHRKLLAFGFNSYRYQPLARELEDVQQLVPGNVLYLRRYKEVRERVKSAPPFRVLKHTI